MDFVCQRSDSPIPIALNISKSFETFLASPTLNDLKISKSFQTDFRRLQTRLILIQEHIPNTSLYYEIPVKALLLVILVHKLDDLLDELNVYAFRQHMDKVPFLTLQPMKIKLLRKLKRILEITDIVTGSSSSISSDGYELHAELYWFLGKLLEFGSENPLVVPILDRASRNSRLAKRAYNRLRSHFDLRIWIDVGGNLDAGKTMKGILERLSEGCSCRSEPLPSELRVLQSLVRESLVGKRYLLVLDDVMHMEQAEWDKLKEPLSTGKLGCKIIFTTEINSVAQSMVTSLLPIDQPLMLSYNNLPPYQRLCLRYCSIFSLNYKINREKLIHQWIALGLIPSITGQHMEQTGKEYFNSFLARFSFFHGVSADDDEKFQEFTIHESFAQIKSVIEEEEIYVPSLTPPAFHLISETDISSSRMHSLFTHLKHLKVLNLSGCGITRLHESIGDLIYLRYLDISSTLVQKLPNNICYLLNLQTLHLSDCKQLRELPTKMSNLINLRHLNIKGCESLARMPANIGKLGNLQTLPIFIVGKELEESLFQLKLLDLRGELEIKLLEKAGYMLPAMCLEYKLLHSLALSWDNDNEAKMDHHLSRQASKGYDSLNAESVLSRLVPNRSLRNLSINEYPGYILPQWLNRIVLPNLTNLVLFNCRRCETLPALGPLQSLRVLNLQGMDAIVRIGSEFFGKEGGTKLFPSLCELILSDFPALRSWESAEFTEVCPSLHKLSIINCPMLTSTPCLPSLQHLDLHNCSKLVLGPAEVSKPFSNLASTLQNLKISRCPELQDFPDWIENLTSLQSLAILHCQNLKLLPEGLKHLRALQCLSVTDCPDLERRCQKVIGEDWQKILHVPYVYVGSSTLQTKPDGATNSSS